MVLKWSFKSLCCRLAGLALCLASMSAQSLQIKSPTEGTVVKPGQKITITVFGGAVSGVLVVGEDPLEACESLTGPPFRCSIRIPVDIDPGTYTLTAFGVLARGESVDSDPISIDVERTDNPTKIISEPSAIELSPNHESTLRVIGTYRGGSTVDLTRSTQTSYVSRAPNIATVTDDGLITAVSPGSTQIVIDGFLIVPVTIDPPIIIRPGQTTVAASKTREFTAAVANAANPAVTWSLNPADVGSIDANGFYTAPASISSAQIVILTATSVANPAHTATATITLSPEASVSVSPSWETLYVSQKQQLHATTSNVGTAGVAWSIRPAGLGTIDANGLYTAPASITSLEKVTVTATSVEKPAISGNATLWLSPQPFLLGSGDSGITVSQGGSAATFVLELAVDGFPHPVAFSVSGLPPGVTANFHPPTVTGSGGTVLRLTASSTALAGDYLLVIKAADTVYPVLVQSQSLRLIVAPSPELR